MNTNIDNMKTLIDSIQPPIILALKSPFGASEVERVAAVKDGFNLIDLEKYLPNPLSMRAKPTFTDEGSFVCYVNNFAVDGSTRIYAELDAEENKFTLRAVIDDHDCLEKMPSWRNHIATYSPKTSLDYRRWIERDRKPFDQEGFAEFIQDNIRAIATPKDMPLMPTGAQMLKVATEFDASTSLRFRSKKNLQNGQSQLTYVEEGTSNETNIIVPDAFALGIKVFMNGDGYQINARLKYRTNSGELKFTYELDRPDLAFDKAARDVIERIAIQTGITPLFGSVAA